jgi:ketosteroid isomerase-like protein
MSREDVDLAQRLYDAVNRRDLDTFLGLTDAEVEFTTRFLQLEGAPEYHGHSVVPDIDENLRGLIERED